MSSSEPLGTFHSFTDLFPVLRVLQGVPDKYRQRWPWSQSWLCNLAPLEAKHFNHYMSAKWNDWDNLRGEMLEGLPPPPPPCLFLMDSTLAEKQISGDLLSLRCVPHPIMCTGQGRGCWVSGTYSCSVSSVKSPYSGRQILSLSLIIDIRIHTLMTGVFSFILCCLLLSKIPFPKPTAKKKKEKKSFLSAAVYWHSTE